MSASFTNISFTVAFLFVTTPRVNHLRELLRQFQGRTTSTVPPEAVEKIYAELAKLTIPRDEITSFTMRKILRRLRFHRYYESLVSLTRRVNPKFEPIKLTPAYEEKLIFQFIQVHNSSHL